MELDQILLRARESVATYVLYPKHSLVIHGQMGCITASIQRLGCIPLEIESKSR